MPRIVNERYKQMLENDSFELFTEEELAKGLAKLKRYKYSNQARAFMIELYYIGAYPYALLQHRPEHYKRLGNMIEIYIPAACHTIARTISIPLKKKHMTELWNYVSSLPEGVNVYYDLASKTKKWRRRNGSIEQFVAITQRVNYLITKIFNVTPMFIMNSRWASLAQNGATMNELKDFKGVTTLDSIHKHYKLSDEERRNIGKKLK